MGLLIVLVMCVKLEKIQFMVKLKGVQVMLYLFESTIGLLSHPSGMEIDSMKTSALMVNLTMSYM